MQAEYLRSLALVAAGGALGSMLRFAAGASIASRTGAGFPWATLTVNVTGCFAIGLVLAALGGRSGPSAALRLFLTTGVLGGFTTFSAFAFETVALAGRGAVVAAAGYVAASVGLGVAAAAAGAAAARALL